MEDKIVVTAEDLGVWAYKMFKKTDNRIKRLSFAVFCLSLGGYFAAREITNSKTRIKLLEDRLEAILETPESE